MSFRCGAMLRHHRAVGEHRSRAAALLGAHLDDVIYRDELEQLDAAITLTRFSLGFHIVLSCIGVALPVII